MQDFGSIENDFIKKLTDIIEENISNEKFGVSELASEIGMSRSNLLRRIKKDTDLSASQFIRQVRLQKAMEILKESSLNVSEVTYQVGFSSTSYFIKCFHDHYGYPPGEVGKKQTEKEDVVKEKKNPKYLYIVLFAVAVVTVSVVFFYKPSFLKHDKQIGKSIAVLPFINDSRDSSNIHIVNGLMESILNNLQKIENLRVISRTSVEKYRDTHKSIPEIAEELNVSYFVEGSGQKIGDQILLNIQLIEAANDKHLWAKQYKKEAKDIFQLQMDVAKSIAGEIEVIITPEEEERINKLPTNNLVAYDYYLKGIDLMYKGGAENLRMAINYFESAIEHDENFARAYAAIASSYYFIDIFKKEKVNVDKINEYADKALAIDPKLAQSLIAKSLFFINSGKNEMAIPYLEKALEYNPNSALVINILSDHYANREPNTIKYLEYALRGVRLDIASHDSTTVSYIYLHLSNALVQAGFVEESEMYVDKSLAYNPNNLFSEYLKAYILYAKNNDLHQTKKLLLAAFEKDTTRLDIMQEIAKVSFYLRDYKESYFYYKKFMDIKKALKLSIYPGENGRIGRVYSEMGFSKESDELFEEYFKYAQNDNSIYKNLSLSVYYAHAGDEEKALEHLELFSNEDHFFYWVLIFLKDDPLFDSVMDNPDYARILENIDTNFWKFHNRIKQYLQEKKLL